MVIEIEEKELLKAIKLVGGKAKIVFENDRLSIINDEMIMYVKYINSSDVKNKALYVELDIEDFKNTKQKIKVEVDDKNISFYRKDKMIIKKEYETINYQKTIPTKLVSIDILAISDFIKIAKTIKKNEFIKIFGTVKVILKNNKLNLFALGPCESLTYSSKVEENKDEEFNIDIDEFKKIIDVQKNFIIGVEENYFALAKDSIYLFNSKICLKINKTSNIDFKDMLFGMKKIENSKIFNAKEFENILYKTAQIPYKNKLKELFNYNFIETDKYYLFQNDEKTLQYLLTKKRA